MLADRVGELRADFVFAGVSDVDSDPVVGNPDDVRIVDGRVVNARAEIEQEAPRAAVVPMSPLFAPAMPATAAGKVAGAAVEVAVTVSALVTTTAAAAARTAGLADALRDVVLAGVARPAAACSP